MKGYICFVRLVRYFRIDRLYLFFGGDDFIVKYWDVVIEILLFDFLGYKDYVRSGFFFFVDDSLFVIGFYDYIVRVWDVWGSNSGRNFVMVVNYGKSVEDVTFLFSGGLIVIVGGNVVKIWDLIGGGKCVFEMESYNKIVIFICVGKVGRDSGAESD